MALAGSNPSRRDLEEFNLMSAEKNVAFFESWNAMATTAFETQQAFMLSWFKAIWMPWLGTPMNGTSITNRMHNTALAIAMSGLTPFHRTAVANAKRLTFTRL
jgi:hypothetical protein